VEITAVGPTEGNICFSTSAGERESPLTTIVDQVTSRRGPFHHLRPFWSIRYICELNGKVPEVNGMQCRRCVKRAQVPPARSLGPSLNTKANFPCGTNALEQSSPSRTDFRYKTNCLEQRRLVSCAVDVSLVVSPWFNRVAAPSLPSLVVRLRIPRLADTRQYTHICKHIVEGGVEGRGCSRAKSVLFHARWRSGLPQRRHRSSFDERGCSALLHPPQLMIGRPLPVCCGKNSSYASVVSKIRLKSG
jgi:hypothetical protein